MRCILSFLNIFRCFQFCNVGDITSDYLRHIIQVLGISNNSYWPEAEKVRMCMETSASAELKLMDLAKKRIDSLLHISLTDHLKESVHSLAVCTASLISQVCVKYIFPLISFFPSFLDFHITVF